MQGRGGIAVLVALACALVPAGVRAQEVGESESESDVEAHVVPPPSYAAPRQYSIPWNMRPAVVTNVVRLDSSVGIHRNRHLLLTPAGTHLLTAGMRIEPWLMGLVRLGLSWSADDRTFGLSNILVGINALAQLDPSWRVVGFFGITIPVGTFGAAVTPQNDARSARLAMDNAMYLVDVMALIGGASVAFVDEGWSLQLDGTLFVLPPLRDAESTLVNSTFGLHVGYTPHRSFTMSAELHHQHLLTTSAAVRANEELRSQTSATFGIRFHIPIEGTFVIHPGIAYGRGFDAPMATTSWNIIQLDLPVTF